MRQPGIAAVLLSLLTHREGNAPYLRAFPELTGRSLCSLAPTFPGAIVLGVFRSREGSAVHFVPEGDVTLEDGDLLILIAESFAHCRADGSSEPQLLPLPECELAPQPAPERRRLLILGWSHKIGTLLAELLGLSVGRLDVTIMSRVAIEERERQLSHLGTAEGVRVRHVEGNHSLGHDLARVEPERFDHVLFLASGWMQSSEEADARTILGVLLLRSLFRGRSQVPELLVELLDPDNAPLVSEAADVVIVSPRILSHLLAHVGLRPELNEVLDELACAGGVGIELRPPGALASVDSRVTFPELQRAAAARGSVALGLVIARGPGEEPETLLNPPRDRDWTLAAEDRVVLLSAGDR